MKASSKPARINRIEVQETIKHGEEVPIIINGILTDSAWDLSDEKILIDEEEQRVSIALIANKKPGVKGLDVITNFSREAKIIFSKKGKWVIKCNNVEISVHVQ